jgi:NADPH-dependent curcumin reductase CurA
VVLTQSAVAGDILDLCLARAKPRARFVECGSISQYNVSTPKGPVNFGQISTMRLRVEGFVILDHKDRFAEGIRDLSTWMNEGRLKSSETIIDGGLGEAEAALIGLFNGINVGKLLVKVKDHT